MIYLHIHVYFVLVGSALNLFPFTKEPFVVAKLQILCKIYYLVLAHKIGFRVIREMGEG